MCRLFFDQIEWHDYIHPKSLQSKRDSSDGNALAARRVISIAARAPQRAGQAIFLQHACPRQICNPG